jgi:hypothetical protein
MSKKFKFSIAGTEFQLPISQVQEDSYNNNEKYIYMNAKSVASVIKQFVKKTYPSLKVWATSDVYSGGSSVRVSVCNQDGSQVEPSIFEEINKWQYMLKAGSFDGMYDIYNYREDTPTTDSGTPMKYFPSYIFIENKPSWGSVEYWINEWNEYQNNYEAEWIEKIQRMGGWLEYNKQFIDKKILDKVASLTVNA